MVLRSAQPYDYELPISRGLALLIIDMQRDFLELGGFGEVLGNNVSQLQGIVPPIKQSLEAFRAQQLPIFHTIEGHLPDLSDCSIAKQKRGQGKLRIGDVGPMGRILVLGEPGNAIIPELEPLPNEKVITKPGKGAFYGTKLDKLLREQEITHLIITGVTTEVCVQTTMREANDEEEWRVASGEWRVNTIRTLVVGYKPTNKQTISTQDVVQVRSKSALSIPVALRQGSLVTSH